MTELDAEDQKIVTLARGARLRGYAPRTGVLEGAAVRDADGRTYAAATVEHSADERLSLSALRVALAAAASSGARQFEAVALVSDSGRLPGADDVAALQEFGGDTVVIAADSGGAVTSRTTAGAL